MAVIPLFGTGQQGKSSAASAQRHLNLYCEFPPDSEKGQLIFYGTPGTTLVVSFGDTPVRGWIAVGNFYYVVHRDTFWEVNNAGVKTNRGTISTSIGHVDMAYDGAVILVATGTNLYTYTVASTTFAVVASGTAPQTANTCAWLDGQFLADQGTGDQVQISPDGITWDALDFAAAESNPDGLMRVFADNGEVVLLGVNTTEFWGNVGAGDFPFVPVKGATQEFGLAARWSLCQFNSGLAGVMKNSMGQVQVMFIQGYVPRPLSSQELDSLIAGYATVADATAFSYMLGGHPMLQVNFPGAGKSWLFDASTNLWSPLEYGLSGARHRADMRLDFLGRTLVGDHTNGNVYSLDPDVYTDAGTAIAREIISRHIFNSNLPVVVDELFIDFSTGIGLTSGQGSNPQAMLSVSKDGGNTWGAEMWTTLGAIGKYRTRAIWRRLGMARDWTFKIRISDPIKVVIAFAAMNVRS